MNKEIDTEYPPKHVDNLDQVSALLGRSGRWLSEWKTTDALFPLKHSRGWPFWSICFLHEARELERMTDFDYDRQQKRNARMFLARLVSGDPETVELCKDFPAVRPMLENTIAGKYDIDDETGLSARQAQIQYCLNQARLYSLE